MDNREEVRRYLASRRARLTTEQVGLPDYGGRRRVAGLRREEVAQLAGVSVDYYTRVERGNLNGVSDSVLHAIARALRLDDDERLHLFDLARAAEARPNPTRSSRPHPARPTLRDSVRAIVDGLVDLPACVTNGRMELVLTNQLGRALYDPMFRSAATARHGLPSHARFVFLDPAAISFWVDWETAATEVVGALRVAAARDPYDKDLTDLIGELATRSDHFRTWWGSHDVFVHRGGVKKINHPAVGRLDLTYEVMHFPFDPDIALLTYSAASGTPTHDSLQLLAAWNATRDRDHHETRPTA